MDVLVTGATGFVGANTARLLVAEGYRVRVLARTSNSLRALEGCPVEVVRGDILDAGSVARAIKGCAQVFHVAADYRLWAKDPGEIYRNNVDGTRTVLDACAQAGVGRVVYTSSVGTIGLPRDGGRRPRCSTPIASCPPGRVRDRPWRTFPLAEVHATALAAPSQRRRCNSSLRPWSGATDSRWCTACGSSPPLVSFFDRVRPYRVGSMHWAPAESPLRRIGNVARSPLSERAR